MQPKKNVDRECIALPDVGPSVIVLDAADNELRDMNWDIRILRGKGPNGEADPEADIVGRLPVQKFRNGMVNFDQNFKEPGEYVLYAKLTSDDGAKRFEGRHPFSVGPRHRRGNLSLHRLRRFRPRRRRRGLHAVAPGQARIQEFRIFRRRTELLRNACRKSFLPNPPPRFAREREQVARVMKICKSSTSVATAPFFPSPVKRGKVARSAGWGRTRQPRTIK